MVHAPHGSGRSANTAKRRLHDVLAMLALQQAGGVVRLRRRVAGQCMQLLDDRRLAWCLLAASRSAGCFGARHAHPLLLATNAKDQFGREMKGVDLPGAPFDQAGKLGCILFGHAMFAPTEAVCRKGDDQGGRIDCVEQAAANLAVHLLQAGNSLEQQDDVDAAVQGGQFIRSQRKASPDWPISGEQTIEQIDLIGIDITRPIDCAGSVMPSRAAPTGSSRRQGQAANVPAAARRRAQHRTRRG